jgi:hypothetical protein
VNTYSAIYAHFSGTFSPRSIKKAGTYKYQTPEIKFTTKDVQYYESVIIT